MTPHKELLGTLVQEVTKIGESINEENEREKRRWENSPFLPLREIHSNKRRGEVLSKLILTLINLHGFDIKFRNDTRHESSVIVIGKDDGQIQIKTSMLSSQGSYTFQQIRKKDKFNALIFFGVSPQEAHWWVVNREVIIDSSNEWIKRKNLNVQHGDIDKLIIFKIQKTPDWLSPLGGNLDKGLDVFRKEVIKLEEIKNKP